tara:strand:- start:88 stop:732 length:645 start_codon:yes stop_codon:yes gene_type:complete
MKVTDKIQITNEDNMALMSRYKDNHFDLAIVDPPYGIGIAEDFSEEKHKGKSMMKGYAKKEWDNKIPSKEYFVELKRVSKNQIIWGGNYFLDYLNATRCFVSWDKMNGTNNMADFELAWTSFNKSCRRFSMHHFSSGYGKKIHPTQKPVKLYEWLLMNYAKESDKILDTHLGSGSIALACHNLGYELTACELDTEYYEASIKRIKDHISQQRLF